jgi:hypothetical protein
MKTGDMNMGGYRVGVAVRAIAAIGGGYLLTSLAASLLASLLPLSRADATVLSTLFSFAIYTCAVIWVFATASAARALAGVALACAALWALLWIYRSF